ncbi:MAG TPA: DUF6174 domain-containing protein [Pirellulales bacterium]
MSSLVAGVALGGIAGLALMIVLVIRARGSALPPLTAEALQAAHDHWKRRGPEDYQMTVVVTGSQSSTYHVQVRGGAPIDVTQGDGLPVRRRATWQYWTVDGLFGVLDHDLQLIDDPAKGFGARPGSAVILRARFDADLGFPIEYERVILSPASQMRWMVKEFRELE